MLVQQISPSPLPTTNSSSIFPFQLPLSFLNHSQSSTAFLSFFYLFCYILKKPVFFCVFPSTMPIPLHFHPFFSLYYSLPIFCWIPWLGSMSPQLVTLSSFLTSFCLLIKVLWHLWLLTSFRVQEQRRACWSRFSVPVATNGFRTSRPSTKLVRQLQTVKDIMAIIVLLYRMFRSIYDCMGREIFSCSAFIPLIIFLRLSQWQWVTIFLVV